MNFTKIWDPVFDPHGKSIVQSDLLTQRPAHIVGTEIPSFALAIITHGDPGLGGCASRGGRGRLHSQIQRMETNSSCYLAIFS